MTQQHKDIVTIIERNGPVSTSEICEYLSTLGYGGAMAWHDFRGSISKQLCYLRDKGDIAGKDRPQAKGKPMRVWALAKVQEMASDVAEVELVATLDSLDTEREIQERQAVAETVTTEPTASVEVKANVKMPMTLSQAIAGVPQWMNGDEISGFMRGIEFAENHHGISQ